MNKSLDEARSQDVAQRIHSKPRKPFDNAYRAALALAGSEYVQGFLVLAGNRCKVVEHAWIELEDVVIDPSLQFLSQPAPNLHYFAAHRLSVKQLKATIEESREDYPDDEPLPIYGTAPYEYYGDVMLGGKDYQIAYQTAQQHCQMLHQGQKGN